MHSHENLRFMIIRSPDSAEFLNTVSDWRRYSDRGPQTGSPSSAVATSCPLQETMRDGWTSQLVVPRDPHPILLVGVVVEPATFIRERHEDDVLVVEAATRSLAGDSEFEPMATCW